MAKITYQDLPMSHVTNFIPFKKKDEKMTIRDLQMSHLIQFIAPGKRKKEKGRKNDISRPPNEPTDRYYTARKKDKKTKKRHLKTSK